MDIVERLRAALVVDATYGKSIRLSLGYDDIKEAADHIEALREALTPSADTKAAYIGEFKFSHQQWNVEGDDTETVHITVPWTTIKEIMAAIMERANETR